MKGAPVSPAGFLESSRGHSARYKNVTFSALRGRGDAPIVLIMENTPPMPAKRALAALDQPAPPADIGPPKRVSKKVMKAIDLLIGGKAKTITEAADQVGLARETLSRNLSRPHVAEIMRQRVIKSLAMAAGRASAVKIDLMESDNAVVADRASSFVLGLLGIQPATSPSVSLNLEIQAGYIIDVSPEPGEAVDRLTPMRTIPHV
jgi:hypothetical protein